MHLAWKPPLLKPCQPSHHPWDTMHRPLSCNMQHSDLRWLSRDELPQSWVRTESTHALGRESTVSYPSTQGRWGYHGSCVAWGTGWISEARWLECQGDGKLSDTLSKRTASSDDGSGKSHICSLWVSQVSSKPLGNYPKWSCPLPVEESKGSIRKKRSLFCTTHMWLAILQSGWNSGLQ